MKSHSAVLTIHCIPMPSLLKQFIALTCVFSFLLRSSLVHVFQAYGCTHLSAGDLLRAERGQEGSEYGQLIGSYIMDGKIVPVEITINLLRKAMEETMQLDQSKFRFLIDDFLRNQDNFQGWTCVMEGKADVQFVLFFDYSNQVGDIPAVNPAHHRAV
uniref:Uncharacterized protein n=1 Tax=Hucho hucho TaxID=62062 RepID=A0A4W5MLW1_9TELE